MGTEISLDVASNAMEHVIMDLVVSILFYATTIRNQGTWHQIAPKSRKTRG
jgi:hypothetical protein